MINNFLTYLRSQPYLTPKKKFFGVCVLVFVFITTSNNIQKSAPVNEPERTLFSSDEVMNIVLKGDLRGLLNDRSDNPRDHSLDLLYKEDSTNITIPVQVKTRGHFRKLKENCKYPPLLIQFSKKGAQLSSVFREQSKLKLVMPCSDDEFVIREWLVYKLYNLLTPNSFNARLVKVNLEDPKNKKSVAPFYGILLEEEKQLAKRNKSTPIERKITPQQTKADAFLTMSVFEYMIGNTDWSVEFMQNIKLFMPDGAVVPIAVPYDFDHAGIVNTSYAMPAEELQMNSVRERRYRGYCINDMKTFDNVVAQFNRLKDDIYKVYTSCSLLDQRYIKSTTQYLDEFYATINNSKKLQKEFSYPCDKSGTGNVIIKGLKKD